jgi:hypothetical protein
MRRERDSVIQQRDALRARIQTLIDQQHNLLDEVSVQASKTAMQHRETAVEESAPAPEPPPAPSPRSKARERARESSEPPKPKESNVIDISEAELVEPQAEDEGRLKIPRIRPVSIPPPQVRIL